jgi:hypothetical protein
MAEDTKGNWEAKEMANGCWAINAGLDNRKTIVQVWDFPEVEANAHLIAAAPEMYEALKEAHQWIFAPDERGEKDVRTVLQHIQQAIAKAEAQNASKQ